MGSAAPDASRGRSASLALLTWVLVAGSLAFAFAAGLYFWPDRNFSLALMVPVLLAMSRASSTGMRVVVVAAVAGDLALSAYTHVSSITWAMSAASLAAACLLALCIREQREQIRRLQDEASDHTRRAEWRERQLADFIDLVRHDLRLPLVAAQMQLQSVSRGPKGEDPRWVKARVGDAREALDQMAATLKNLLDVERQESGFLPLEVRIVNLRELLTTTLGRGAGVVDPARVQVEVPAGLKVAADPYQLGRIVENLVVNALTYSPAGTPVTITAAAEPRAVRLSVIDRGMGIAPEDLPHVFEPGFRGARARHLADGAGLGLYVARLFAEAHGGGVSAQSVPGQGSSFQLVLPIGPAPSASRSDAGSPGNGVAAPGRAPGR